MFVIWKFGGLTWKELLTRTWRQLWNDRVSDQSATLSFYFLLSLFPLLLFLFALMGLLLQSNSVTQEVLYRYLATILPPSASSLIDTTLGEITRGADPFKLSIALLFLWWSAVQGMLAIIEGLNIAYKVEEARSWWRKYAVASGLTIVFLLLAAAALLLLLYGERLSEIIASHVEFGGSVVRIWQVLRWFLVLAFVLMAFNILYVYAPNVRHREWHWLMPGTVVGVSLWLLASGGFQLYLRFFNQFTVTYGTIGAVIILLLWLYLSGIAFLAGAEVNSVIEGASNEICRDDRR